MSIVKLQWCEEQMNELDDKIHEQIDGIYDLPLKDQVPRFYELLRLSEEVFRAVSSLDDEDEEDFDV